MRLSGAGSAAKLGLGLAMAVIIWASFLWARPAENFVGESSRIVFYHVPMAWVATVAFFLAAWHSAVYLRKRRPESDEAAAAAARLGLVFCVLATVTGAIFARVMWNAYWNWDPRQTSITLLLLVYGAYLGLRGAIEDPERRATLSAAYALVAFVTVPFLMFAVPRMYASLHPDTVINARGKVEMSRDIKTVFFAANLAFLVLFFWLYSLDRKVSRLLREARP
ncbi:MAG TPA: cytochrome c biogenesis protein [Thermoanaerobaculia bacterium]|nr:cytochrome c biogenesis protein [Thermoanaerobaculia bacterium]